MRSVLKFFFIFYLFCIPLLVFCKESRQVFASKEFYLIDGLNLSELYDADRTLLDSCLEQYHNDKEDTSKINTLYHICEQLNNEKWKAYQLVQLRLIQRCLMRNPSPQVALFLKRRLSYAWRNIGLIYSSTGKYHKSLEYGIKSLKLAIGANEKKVIPAALNDLAYKYRIFNDFDQSWNYAQKALRLADVYGDQVERAVALDNLGYIFFNNGEIDTCLFYMLKALGVKRNLGAGYRQEVARSLNEIAVIYIKKGDLERALTMVRKSLKIFSESQPNISTSYAFTTLGGIHAELGDYKAALVYFKQSLKIRETLGAKGDMVQSLINIAHSYAQQDSVLISLRYLHEAAEFANEVGLDEPKMNVLHELAVLYQKQGNFTKSLTYFKRSLEFKRKIGAVNDILPILINIADLYLIQNQLYKAAEYAEQGLNLAKKSNFPKDIGILAKLLSEIYEKQNNQKLALEMFKLYANESDNIGSAETQKMIKKLEVEHKLTTKNQQIEILRRQNEIKEHKLRLTIVVWVFVFVSILGLVYGWYKTKDGKYEKELNTLRKLKLQKSEQAKSSYINSIAVTVGRKISFVPLEKIIYFGGDGRYVFLVEESGKSYIVDYTMSSLEKDLPNQFIRVHRSYILNRNKVGKVDKITRGRIKINMKDTQATSLTSSSGYMKNAEELWHDYAQSLSTEAI